MSYNYAKNLNYHTTPQSEPIPGKENLMVKNSAGGYSFNIDMWKLLNRFLILGTEGGTYYISESNLTRQNVDNLKSCIKQDESKVLDCIVEISTTGRAPKNDPAIFALAALMVYGSEKIKKDIANVFPKICRTGTHLFTFVYYVDTMRSWGRSLRKTISQWYNTMNAEQLAFQIVKYQGRTVEGTKNQWTHCDVLRSAHVKPISEQHNAIFKYIVKKEIPDFSSFISAYEELKVLKDNDVKKAIKLIKDNKIPHDVWPTELKNYAEVWEAVLDDIPLMALIRNLGKLTSIDVLKTGKFDTIEIVNKKLSNSEYIRKSLIHPISILIALKTYEEGYGFKGKLSWSPVQHIIDALNEAFYLSFTNIIPTGKRFCLGIDVSSSMLQRAIGTNGVLTCSEVASAMSMITARTEQKYAIMGFSDRFKELGITPKMRFEEILNKVINQTFGSTDCALPMIWALNQNIEFDVFCIYTDNETWAGKIHPVQALQMYRQKTGIDAKLIVLGMATNNFSIADPTDPGMLDIVGFDSAVPQIINEFVR